MMHNPSTLSYHVLGYASFSFLWTKQACTSEPIIDVGTDLGSKRDVVNSTRYRCTTDTYYNRSGAWPCNQGSAECPQRTGARRHDES